VDRQVAVTIRLKGHPLTIRRPHGRDSCPVAAAPELDQLPYGFRSHAEARKQIRLERRARNDAGRVASRTWRSSASAAGSMRRVKAGLAVPIAYILSMVSS
jgi:hypothetical protein